jgi:2,3-bisphosphoglycerate-independent phosphoglycerate mutase
MTPQSAPSPFAAPVRPVVLCILDGWGHNPSPEHNAIAAARTPVWDSLLARYPHGLIHASEHHVGLPDGQMGNSEVGHMNLGSGRILTQDLPRIDKAIAEGSIAQEPELQDFIARVKAGSGRCHLLGLLSDGGVHAHQDHIHAVAKILADGGLQVFIHAFLDGRDTSQKSAEIYLKRLEDFIGDNPHITLATVGGRYFAMDRDNRWDRVEKAFGAMVSIAGPRFATGLEALQAAYAHDVTDEFVPPAVIGHYAGMGEGDGLFMANFRADRARQILSALLEPSFTHFPRSCLPPFTAALGMVEYSSQHNEWLRTLYPPQELHGLLGEVVAKAGMKQLRIAETEKYAHVTFFFNGGREEPFEGETRILVPSPKVATYDLQPEMSAPEVADKLAEAIRSGEYGLCVVNFANTDMVGHTGNFDAAVKAVECVDNCLGKVWQAVEEQNGLLLVTADHGNAEMMHDNATHQPHTAHTLLTVPLVLAARALEGWSYQASQEGELADIAPTVLQALDLPQPDAMTGHSLLQWLKAPEVTLRKAAP